MSPYVKCIIAAVKRGWRLVGRGALKVAILLAADVLSALATVRIVS